MKKQSVRLIACLLLAAYLMGVFGMPASAAVQADSQNIPEVKAVTAGDITVSPDSFITTSTENTAAVNVSSLTWKNVSGHLQLRDSKGKPKKGFVKFKNKLYYFDSKGNLKTGFFKVGNKTFYASKRMGYKGKGQILTGLVWIGKWIFYLNPASKPHAGAVTTGFKKIKGYRYYFNSKGHMVTGWFTVGGNKYYASRNKKTRGRLLTGVRTIGGKVYRFSSTTGRLLTSLPTSAKYPHLIDVSEHQGSIDFRKVKASGVRTVIIRAGYGQDNIDKWFYDHIKKAKAAGLKIGIYWFSYAYKTSQAVNEAKFCLKVIRKYGINLPVYFDWEYDSMAKANARGHYPGRTEITEMTRAFCSTIVKGGRRAGYYFNLHYLNSYYTPSRLKGYSTWYAIWGSNSYADNIWSRTDSMSVPVQYDIWQFSSRGRIPGISGDVDCDLLLHPSILK